METLLFLMQARSTTPASSVFEAAGIIGLVITVLMLIGGIYVVVKYPVRSTGMLLGAILMLLPFTGLILVAFSNLTHKRLPESAWLAVPVAWLTWLAMFIFAYVTIRRAVADEKPHETFQLPPKQSDYDPDLVDDGVVDAVTPPAAELTPRRAVSIPVAESDSGRASEQTLKRMTLEKLESAKAAPKGPRAGEIPENPILPDEVVKIRCLACDKKMQAEGPKFMKQRRCPHCRAEPFRYVTAV